MIACLRTMPMKMPRSSTTGTKFWFMAASISWIHAGGHGDSLVVALVGKAEMGISLSRFQIQTMEFFQSPQNIALGQGAHIFPCRLSTGMEA